MDAALLWIAGSKWDWVFCRCRISCRQVRFHHQVSFRHQIFSHHQPRISGVVVLLTGKKLRRGGLIAQISDLVEGYLRS
jgi:hypothetical protein